MAAVRKPPVAARVDAIVTEPSRPKADERGYWMIKDNAITREWKELIKRAADAREMGTYHWIVTVLTRQAKIALGELPRAEPGPALNDIMARLETIDRRQEELVRAMQAGVPHRTPTSDDELVVRLASQLLKLAREAER
jgi:uncharacterized protein (DUF1778 family)